MSKECIKLHFNWRQCGEASDQWGDDYDIHEVGRNDVVSIRNNHPINPDVYSVSFEDGSQELIYNPNRVFFSA